ncbi:MAG: HD domain-containing protein [bacterium]
MGIFNVLFACMILDFKDIRGMLRIIAYDHQNGIEATHDFHHTERVVMLAVRIARDTPGANPQLVEMAAWLHDIGRSVRDDSRSHALISAEMAVPVLNDINLTDDEKDEVLEAIKGHSFSAGSAPVRLTGKILQDADRLDAIGSVGIARTFALSEGRMLYHSNDPFVENRDPDDENYILDHFYAKLLKLPEKMHTEEAKRMASERIMVMHAFLDALRSELNTAEIETGENNG